MLLKPKKRLYLFSGQGQSNESGEGDPALSPTVPSGTAWQYSDGQILPANNPVGNQGVPQGNSGKYPAFCKRFNEITGEHIGIVPSGVGGSSILEAADDGHGNWNPAGPIFAKAKQDYLDARIAFEVMNYDVIDAGVSICQGENEAIAIATGITGVSGALWEVGFTRYQAAWREQVADVPFFIFRTGVANGMGTAYDAGFSEIRNAQESVATTNRDTHIVYRGASDFIAKNWMNGPYHYKQEGYNESGVMGAEEIAARIAPVLYAECAEADAVTLNSTFYSQLANLKLGPGCRYAVSGFVRFKSLAGPPDIKVLAGSITDFSATYPAIDTQGGAFYRRVDDVTGLGPAEPIATFVVTVPEGANVKDYYLNAYGEFGGPGTEILTSYGSVTAQRLS